MVTVHMTFKLELYLGALDVPWKSASPLSLIVRAEPAMLYSITNHISPFYAVLSAFPGVYS
jgi:hypothetical protein